MNLEYVEAGKKYKNIDFSVIKVVDAEYSKSIIAHENGNPFIEALPTIIPKREFALQSFRSVPDYKHELVSQMSDDERYLEVQKLRGVRFPLPYLNQIYKVFHTALRTSYSMRNLFPIDVDVTIRNENELSGLKSVSDDSGDPSNGFTLLGASGCGKSSSIKMMLDQFPQLILHKDKSYGEFLQIVYLKVNCLPNNNLSALLDSIGKEIDKVLHNSVPVYENEIKRAKTIGNKVNKVCSLIEVFSIGALILDEIQLLNFDSNKETSFESILAISNNTKIAIIAVGTEDAYAKMFPNLRTSRRTGMRIDASAYCRDKAFFINALSWIWRFQWFDEQLPQPTQEIYDEFYSLTKGIIDQVIKIYIQMHLDYLQNEERPCIDKDYIANIVTKYYPGTVAHLKKLPMKPTKISSEDVLTLKEMQCVEELKRVLAITKKVYNKESIANAIKKAAKKTKNMSVQDIVTDAYQILLKSPSDERRQKPAVKKKIDHEKEKDELLKTVKNL